jgi:uncharacterized protein YhaN
VASPSEQPARLIASLLVREAAREELARKRAELAAALERERAERQATAERERARLEAERRAEEARKAREAREQEEARQQKRREIEAQEAQKRAAMAARKAREQIERETRERLAEAQKEEARRTEEQARLAKEAAWAAARRLGLSGVASIIGFNVLPAVLLTLWAAPAAWGDRYFKALWTLACLAAVASICSLIIGRLASITAERLFRSMLVGAVAGTVITGVVLERLISGGQVYGSVFPMTTWLVYPSTQVVTVFLSAVMARRSG